MEAAGFLVVVAIRRAFGLFPFRQYWCGTNFGVGREPKIAVPRRHRRAKTDAIDGERLLRTLMAWQRGEPLVCAMTVPLGSAAGT